MDCKEIEEELTALVDNETPVFRKLLLKIHLWHCKYCREIFNIEAGIKKLVCARAGSHIASDELRNKVSARLTLTRSSELE